MERKRVLPSSPARPQRTPHRMVLRLLLAAASSPKVEHLPDTGSAVALPWRALHAVVPHHRAKAPHVMPDLASSQEEPTAWASTSWSLPRRPDEAAGHRARRRRAVTAAEEGGEDHPGPAPTLLL